MWNIHSSQNEDWMSFWLFWWTFLFWYNSKWIIFDGYSVLLCVTFQLVDVGVPPNSLVGVCLPIFWNHIWMGPRLLYSVFVGRSIYLVWKGTLTYCIHNRNLIYACLAPRSDFRYSIQMQNHHNWLCTVPVNVSLCNKECVTAWDL